MISLRRRALSVLCAVTLVASMVPTQAFAETPAGDDLNDAPDIELMTIEADMETSARELQELIQPFSLSSVGPVPLKSTNETLWIDRLDLSGYEFVREFYNALVEGSDCDGSEDFLIEDKYIKGRLSAKGINVGDYYRYAGSSPTIIAYVGTIEGKSPEDRIAEVTPYIFAAVAAFDRDHPEVFWLGDRCGFVAWTQGQKLYMGYNISDGVRSDSYSSETTIKQGIKKRDASVATILKATEAVSRVSSKVKGFNKWLTENNAYNSNLGNAQLKYRDAWECISALVGKAGVQGPVCEGYARALKVLCDRSNIPCVLVDGQAKTSSSSSGEAHMWNYVQVEDGKWYAVDVTWNDPGSRDKALSGFENEDWLLVGAETSIKGMPFLSSHPVANRVFADKKSEGEGLIVRHVAFTNGPALNGARYSNELAEKDCRAGKHQFFNYVYNNDATCRQDGTEVAKCLYCDAKGVRCAEGSSKTAPHSYGSWTVAKEATCTASGTKLRRCVRSGCSKVETQVLAARGHAFGAYRPNGDAKVGLDGTETATCSRCGAKTTRTAAGSALAPQTGQTVVVDAVSYKVTGTATVTYAGLSNKKAASVTVPATVAISGRTYKVTAIAPKAFAGNKYLKSVKIGANVAAVPASAFKGCTKLTSVNFGNGITSLGKNAFYGCKALKSVTLGTKVATIGDGAFQNCAKLTKVTVKSTKLSKVGKNAFAGCKKLGTITLKTTKLKSVGKNAFKGTKSKMTVKVPKKQLKAYQKLCKNKGSKTLRVKK